MKNETEYRAEHWIRFHFPGYSEKANLPLEYFEKEPLL